MSLFSGQCTTLKTLWDPDIDFQGALSLTGGDILMPLRILCSSFKTSLFPWGGALRWSKSDFSIQARGWDQMTTKQLKSPPVSISGLNIWWIHMLVTDDWWQRPRWVSNVNDPQMLMMTQSTVQKLYKKLQYPNLQTSSPHRSELGGF